MTILTFLFIFQTNLLSNLKEAANSLACLYLKQGNVPMKEILRTLRKNKVFYSNITPFFITARGATEGFEIPQDLFRAIERSGNFYASGECTIKNDKAYIFLSFKTPYKIEEISGREIKLEKMSQIKKLKIIKEMDDERCEFEEIPAKEKLILKFEGEIRKVEITDYETDLPFIIIPFSDELFPEIPKVPPSSSIENRIFELINAERRLRGLRELIYSEEISRVSRKHSEDMAKKRFFSHFSPSTGSPSDRMKRAGINFSKVSENIGLGENADEIHTLLMDSPAHKCNILDPEMEKVGVGAYFHDEEWWVTENFIKEKEKEDFDFEKHCSILKEDGLNPLSDELFKKIKSGEKITDEFLEGLIKKYGIPYSVQIQYIRSIDPSKVLEEIKKPCSIFYRKYGEEEFIIIIKR
jgi:uncharacterized protein YkwD